MTVIDVGNPLKHDITKQWLASQSPPRKPLLPGDTWFLRFYLRDSTGAPIDLTIPTAVTRIKVFFRKSLKAGSFDVERSSDDPRNGAAGQQVEVDDQAVPILDAGVVIGGTGWGTAWLDPNDKAALLTVSPIPFYQVKVFYVTARAETVLMGRLEMMLTPDSF